MFKLSFPTFFLKLWEVVYGFLHITITRGNAEISRTREIEASGTRDINPQNGNKIQKTDNKSLSTPPPPTPCFSHCPSCGSDQIVRRGFRSNTRERVQLYLCRDCAKTFTPQIIKGKHYPMEVVLEGISYYNLGFSLERSCELLKEKFALQSQGLQNQARFEVQPSTLSNWIEESKELCRYHRYRPFAVKMFSPEDTVWTVTLAHRQLYRFRLHRAKIALITKEDIRHQRFSALKDYLELVPGECPHQYFQEGLRASEMPIRFSKTEMIV